MCAPLVGQSTRPSGAPLSNAIAPPPDTCLDAVDVIVPEPCAGLLILMGLAGLVRHSD
jgi:hypothetical protein